MVLTCGQHEGWLADGGKVDRNTVEFDAASAGSASSSDTCCANRSCASPPACVNRNSNRAGRREGLLAQQVVADDEGPDQVIAQHVEGRRHVGAIEIPALIHLALEGGGVAPRR